MRVGLGAAIAADKLGHVADRGGPSDLPFARGQPLVLAGEQFPQLFRHLIDSLPVVKVQT